MKNTDSGKKRSPVMLFTGRQPVVSRHGLAATVAWGRNGQTYYGLEGNINYAGAVIEWLIHRAGLLTSADEAEALALQAAPAEDTTPEEPALTDPARMTANEDENPM